MRARARVNGRGCVSRLTLIGQRAADRASTRCCYQARVQINRGSIAPHERARESSRNFLCFRNCSNIQPAVRRQASGSCTACCTNANSLLDLIILRETARYARKDRYSELRFALAESIT